MKTGFGIYRKLRYIFSYYNLYRFALRKNIIGFDVANQFIQRVDKYSIQLILRKNGASIGSNCDIETGLTFHNCKDYSNLIIGENCHIGKNCFFDLRDRIEIGNNVVISMQCSFITHIDMTKSPLNELFPASQAPIIIQNGSYIGVGSKILMGVKICQNSFVAAYSLIINNVNQNCMVGGIPARVIKRLIFE